MKEVPVRQASVLLLVFLLLSVAIASTFGQFAPGQLGQSFHEEFGMPIALVGLLTSASFAASGIAAIPAGWIADRVAPKILAPIQVLVSAAAFGSFAFARSEASLIGTCIAIGVSMSFMNPIANRIITLYAPRSAFSRIMGWKSVGPQIGGVFAGLTLGGFTNLIDWRIVVLILATIMAIPAVWAWIVLHRYGFYVSKASVMNVDGIVSVDCSDEDPAPEKTRAIVWWLLPYLVFSSGVVSSVGAFIPLYATREIGLSLAMAGAAVSVIAGVSVIMRFVWIRFLTPDRAVPLLILAGVLTAISSLVLVISPVFGPWMFWTGAVLVGACAMGATPIPQIVLVQNADPRKVGMVSAWSGLATMFSFTVQPVVISLLVNQIAFPLVWLTLTVCGIGAALTMVTFQIVHRRASRLSA